MPSYFYGKDYHYALSRLQGTVVMHKGVPRLVKNIGTQTGKTVLSKLDGSCDYEAHVDELVVNDYQLGFCNSFGVKYLSRIPNKQYKQGIREDTLYDLISRCHTPVETPGLANTMMGIYPSINTAIELVETEGCSTAFHRRFAVTDKELGGYKLLFKTKHVGLIHLSDFGQPVVELKDQFKWLEETVQEAV